MKHMHIIIVCLQHSHQTEIGVNSEKHGGMLVFLLAAISYDAAEDT